MPIMVVMESEFSDEISLRDEISTKTCANGKSFCANGKVLGSIEIMKGFKVRVDLGFIQVYIRFAEVKWRKEGILGRKIASEKYKIILRRNWVNCF